MFFFVSSILPKKNERKQFDLRYNSSKVELFCLFFGKNEDTKKTFQNQLTFLGSGSNKNWAVLSANTDCDTIIVNLDHLSSNFLFRIAKTENIYGLTFTKSGKFRKIQHCARAAAAGPVCIPSVVNCKIFAGIQIQENSGKFRKIQENSTLCQNRLSDQYVFLVS